MSTIGVATLGALLFGFAWILAEGWRNFPGAGDDAMALVIRPAWLCWLGAGVVTGRDLFWHPALHKCRALGLSARRSYLLGVPLGFLSAPLLAVALVVVVRAYASVAEGGGRLLALGIAFILASLTAMLCVSIARNLLLKSAAVPARLLIPGAAVVLAAVASVAGPLFGLRPSPFSVVDLLAASMGGRSWPVLPSVFVALLLTLADATLYSVTVHSGLRGDNVLPAAWTDGLRSRPRFWNRGGVHALSTIAMLGWLRNRAAMLLFLWGLGYGVGYVLITKPESPTGILGFFWMLSVFHSYLRGNLFGVDRRAAWWYSAIPQGLHGGLTAKNRSLSQLQHVMFSGVLLACVTSGQPVFREAPTLVALVSCAVTMTTVGEIVGSVTSVRWPDPIERASQYSGGTALGAFVVPVALTIVAAALAVLLAATPARLSASTAALMAMGIALGVKALQVAHRRTFLVKVIAAHGEDMRKQLAAFRT